MLLRWERSKAAQKLGYDSHAKLHEYKIGDNIMARNYGSGHKWESAIVVEGPFVVHSTTQFGCNLVMTH